MREWKKVTALLLAAVVAANISVIDSSAASRKKITSVSLEVTSNINVGDDMGDDMGDGELEITTKSSKFTVGEYSFTNAGFEWTEEDVPEVEVYLYAEEGYYFNVPVDSIALEGAGASYVSKKLENYSETMILTVRLSPLSEMVGAIDSVQLGTDGWANWTAPTGAGAYEVYLYRDGKSVGSPRNVSEARCYVGGSMTRSAGYTVKVRGVNRLKPENKGKWTESNNCYITEDQAKALKAAKSSQTGWVQDDTGWWYREADGSYPKNDWRLINDKWYYFYDTGYMATGWLEWNGKQYYLGEDGSMLANATTPDGRQVGQDGALIP